MRAVLPGTWRAALVCGLAAGVCMAQAPTATQETTPQPGVVPTLNPPISVSMTCGDLNALLKAADKRTGGLAILWLDGYYAGRSGLSELPAGLGADREPRPRGNLRHQRQRGAHRSRCRRSAPSGVREPKVSSACEPHRVCSCKRPPQTFAPLFLLLFAAKYQSSLPLIRITRPRPSTLPGAT